MRRPKMYAFFLLLVLVLALAWAAMANWVLPPRVFRKALLDPIPASVQRIRGVASNHGRGRMYVLHFDISEPDLRLILASGHFKEMGYAECRGNRLVYGETRETARPWEFSGAAPKMRPPRWCASADDNAFKAYVVEEIDVESAKLLVRLLLYNQSIGEAYYVEYDNGGT